MTSIDVISFGAILVTALFWACYQVGLVESKMDRLAAQVRSPLPDGVKLPTAPSKCAYCGRRCVTIGDGNCVGCGAEV